MVHVRSLWGFYNGFNLYLAIVITHIETPIHILSTTKTMKVYFTGLIMSKDKIDHDNSKLIIIIYSNIVISIILVLRR